MLVEKLYAKVSGNYEFAYGPGDDSFSNFLFAAPVTLYSTSQYDGASAYEFIANALA